MHGLRSRHTRDLSPRGACAGFAHVTTRFNRARHVASYAHAIAPLQRHQPGGSYVRRSVYQDRLYRLRQHGEGHRQGPASRRGSACGQHLRLRQELRQALHQLRQAGNQPLRKRRGGRRGFRRRVHRGKALPGRRGLRAHRRRAGREDCGLRGREHALRRVRAGARARHAPHLGAAQHARAGQRGRLGLRVHPLPHRGRPGRGAPHP